VFFFSQEFTIHYCTFNFPSIHVDVVVQSDYFLATKMIMTISFTSQIYTYVLLKYKHVLAVYQMVQVVLMLQAEALGKDKILKCSGCQALSTKIYRALCQCGKQPYVTSI